MLSVTLKTIVVLSPLLLLRAFYSQPVSRVSKPQACSSLVPGNTTPVTPLQSSFTNFLLQSLVAKYQAASVITAQSFI